MAGKRKSKTGEEFWSTIVFLSGIHANNLIFVTAWTASRAGLSTNFPK